MIFKTSFLLAVLFASISGLRVNENLETSVFCNSTEDCFQYSPEALGNAVCNSNGICQCPFQYYPKFIRGEEYCVGKTCYHSSTCVDLYLDENSTCTNEAICDCREQFKLNRTSQECEYENPEVVALGQNCSASDQCGRGASCVAEGYCKCSIGHVPETAITCRRPSCDSDAFCNAQVTLNSRCNSPGSELSQCICKDDFRPDFFSEQCVPRSRKIGETCNHTIYPFFCGSQSWCVSGICKCPMNMIPEPKYRMDCEEITCSNDSDCHVSDKNTVCQDRKCECSPEHVFNNATVSCVPSEHIYQSVMSFFLLYSGFSFCMFCIFAIPWLNKREIRNQEWAQEGLINRPPPYAE